VPLQASAPNLPCPALPNPQVAKLLVYSPTQRATALDAMRHPFFDELRDPACRLPNGRPLPPLFNWIDGELQQAAPELHAALQPRPAAASP
jgi:glycogen synthase kinase 3 beta